MNKPDQTINDYIQMIDDLERKLEKAEKFEKHIKSHLQEGEVVICKICGKTAEEIKGEALV